MNPVTLNIRSAYLAGPMRGIQEYNFPAFRAAARWLRGMGWGIYSPAERDEDDAVALENHERHREIDQWGTALPLDYYMEFDLAAVCRTDAVILLPDWEKSQGARLEARVATELGHPVFSLITEDNDAYALLSVEPTEVNTVFVVGGPLEGDLAQGDTGDACGCDECLCISEPTDTSFVDIANQYFGSRNFDAAVDVDINQAEDRAVEATLIETESMRVFATGATRNIESDPDYHGFISPLALHAYGDYMHRHRLQADGSLRDSDNWQKGIPNDAFVRSMVRHVHDIQLIHDGYGELARTDDRDENVLLSHLAAALFNVQGMLHNVLKANLEEEE